MLSLKTSGNQLSFQIDIDSLQNGNDKLTELQIAILTVEKINVQNFLFNQGRTLMDWIDEDESLSRLQLQTITSEQTILSTRSSSLCFNEKKSACIASVTFKRVR